MAASAARLAMESIEASAACCAHCRRHCSGVPLKRCSGCKQVYYCGAECQNAAWRRHKKTCEPPLPLNKVRQNLKADHDASDWRAVLKWERRMEELLEGCTDASCEWHLHVFAWCHAMGRNSTRSRTHALAAIGLEERRVELLGKMERFRDQGAALCSIGDSLYIIENMQAAATHYQRARDLGAAHGFFSVECEACMGLGLLALEEGRHEEGLDLYRNAVAAAPLNESDASSYELNALQRLTEALLTTSSWDELEPLAPRYREVARAESANKGRMSHLELKAVYLIARLHEVPFSLGPRVEPL